MIRGKGKLFICEESNADHRIYNSGEGRKNIPIYTITLDDYFKGQQVNFLKIDVQGSEIAVLTGAKDLIKTSKKLKMLLEFWPHGLAKSGSSPKKVLSTLKRGGFQVYDLTNLERKVILEKIIKSYPIKSKKFTNLLCIKK